jgi:putative transcriptional regulator
MQLSDNIRLLREKYLLTQEEFAKELGVASSTVNRWETGKARPNMTAMRTIKIFCESRNYPYEEIESLWLTH